MRRLATAAVLAPVLWCLIKLAPRSVFLAVTLLVVAAACLECYRMLDALDRGPFRWLGLTAAIALVLSFAVAGRPLLPLLPLAAATMLTPLAAMRWRDTPLRMLDAWLSTLFPVLFVGLSLAYLVGLRWLPGEDGADLLLLLFLCVIFGDTAAYYVGGALGRHRMAPLLSPKKSWEGAAGGLCGSLLGAVIAHVWFYQRLPIGHALALGLILGLAGMLGDLVESMLKRAAGVKDSSRLLPGHGGLLDRTDSLLFAGPILYYYSRAFLEVVW